MSNLVNGGTIRYWTKRAHYLKQAQTVYYYNRNRLVYATVTPQGDWYSEIAMFRLGEHLLENYVLTDKEHTSPMGLIAWQNLKALSAKSVEQYRRDQLLPKNYPL